MRAIREVCCSGLAFSVLHRGGWIACALVLALLSPVPVVAQDDAFQNLVRPFLKENCIACHGPKKQESRLRLDEVTGVQAGNHNLWTMVHERISAGEVMPKDRPQPADAVKQKLLTWIAEQQRALGPGGTRRLNRRELAAALRDVTGLAIDFAQALPGDGTVGGFDTGADALQEASDAVAQWLSVTRRAVAGIHFLPPTRGKVFSANFRDVQPVKKGTDPYKKIFDEWKEQGAIAKVPGQIAIGQLPRGAEFRTFAEFKAIIVKDYQADMVRGIMKNFMIYATGRLPGIDDRAEIAAIMKDHRARDHPLRDLLKAMVRSRAFLELPASPGKVQP